MCTNNIPFQKEKTMLEQKMIQLTGNLYGTVHEYPVQGGKVFYYIGAGRNGWMDRTARIFYLDVADGLLRYLGEKRVSYKISEKTVEREWGVRVVVENLEEDLGTPTIIGNNILKIPYILSHNVRGEVRKIKEIILELDIQKPIGTIAL